MSALSLPSVLVLLFYLSRVFSAVVTVCQRTAQNHRILVCFWSSLNVSAQRAIIHFFPFSFCTTFQMFLKIFVELLIVIKLSSFEGADHIICFKIFINCTKRKCLSLVHGHVHMEIFYEGFPECAS